MHKIAVTATETLRVSSSSGAMPIPRAEDFVYADIFSQAITGELVGMANYAAMVRLHRDVAGQADALRHAASELRHAEAFRGVARSLGLKPIENPQANYWGKVRAAFLRHADAEDLLACMIIQEVMLESFAVSLYAAVGEVDDARVAKVFRGIGAEEGAHIDHAMDEMRAAIEADRDGFEAKVEALHDEVVTVLAQMVAGKDTAGHCGLCHGSCVKGALAEVGLDRATLRGRAINYYLRTLDRIGVRGEKSLAWVARLPL